MGVDGNEPVTRTEYYERVKAKARQLRAERGWTSPRVMLSDVRALCRDHGVKVEYWTGKLRVARGQYRIEHGQATIMVSASLPREQRLSTIAHELKHHFFDADPTTTFPDKEAVEISAEIFAVELIFPDEDFLATVRAMGIQQGECCPADVVKLKQESETTLSWGSIAKRMVFHRYATPSTFEGAKWTKIAEEIYGEPFYKRLRRRTIAT